jgi:hypothetical protein
MGARHTSENRYRREGGRMINTETVVEDEPQQPRRNRSRRLQGSSVPQWHKPCP